MPKSMRNTYVFTLLKESKTAGCDDKDIDSPLLITEGETYA